MAAVTVESLTKTYGPVRALDGIDFTVEAGEVVALLGPNGAGKTTAIEIIEGYRTADSGTVSVLGHDPATAGPEFRDRIGIVLQHSGIERESTVRESLERLTGFYSTPADVADLIEMVDLTTKADHRIKTLSGGQRRRLDLAAALAGNPSLVFLDEPTTGFDPAARRDAWRLVRRLTSGGATVILTTHYLDEAQHLADRVVVISHGRIVATGDPATLAGRDSDVATIRFALVAGWGPDRLPALPGEIRVQGPRIEITTGAPTAALHLLTGWAVERGVELDGLEVHRPTLEDVYLQLIGGETT